MADLGILLVLAARRGDLAEVRRLLDEGADIESRSTPGRTPLMEACRYGRNEVARELMARGATLSFHPPTDGNCPLELCIRSGHIDLAWDVLERRALEGRSEAKAWPVEAAAESGSLDLLEGMAKLGAAVDRGVSPSFAGPLHLAVRRGRLEVVRWLLDNGADPNDAKLVTRNRLQTPLDLAIAAGNIAAAELLRERSGRTADELGIIHRIYRQTGSEQATDFFESTKPPN